jgi:hypothetical protein
MSSPVSRRWPTTIVRRVLDGTMPRRFARGVPPGTIRPSPQRGTLHQGHGGHRRQNTEEDKLGFSPRAAYADSFDDSAGRYRGLRGGQMITLADMTSSRSQSPRT